MRKEEVRCWRCRREGSEEEAVKVMSRRTREARCNEEED